MEIKLKNLEKEKEFEQLETKLKQVMQNDGVEDYKEALEATMYGNVGGFARPTTSVGSRGVKEKDNGNSNSNGNGSVVNSAVGNNNNVNNITNINSNVGHLTVADQEPKKDSMFGKNSMFGNNNKTENVEETITDQSTRENPNSNTISNPTPVAQPTTTETKFIDDDNLEMPTEYQEFIKYLLDNEKMDKELIELVKEDKVWMRFIVSSLEN